MGALPLASSPVSQTDTADSARAYDDSLDSTGPVSAPDGTPVTASQHLKQHDPIAYRIGLAEYRDEVWATR